MTERNMQLEDWLDDLCVRFIMNLPRDDLSSVERICFQVEEAQWFYEDFVRPLDPSLPSMSLRRFCERIFAHCPLLSPFSQGRHMQAFEQFLAYKSRIPVRGAIMLNEDMDSVVLVKGWKKNANWSFPRGKINKDEDDLICAIREVYEETGYNLEEAGLVPKSRDVHSIVVNMHEQELRLFVFRDVPMDTHFEPRTRKEISKIEWWRLSELPAFRRKGQQEQQNVTTNANKFYMVAPFLVPLRKWVVEQKKKDAKRISSNQYLSAGLSHDDFLTEEDQGAESAGPAPFIQNTPGGVDLDTLAGATAALRGLLKIQQPPQELQAHESPVPTKSNTGEALLALLHAKPGVSQEIPHNAPPHTPLDHNIQQPSIPDTPHYHHPRPAQLSNMPPPPSFPIQPPKNTFSYQQPNVRSPYQPHATQQGYMPFQTQQRHGNPNSYQSQHLIHPQPLPPHVQRAVFTGGPVHAPMVPPPIQQPIPQHPPSELVTNPQFPGLHSPMVPPVPKQSPPKLTSHSLALLNAFKSNDHASVGGNDLPLRRYTQEPVHAPPHPQELPADAALATQQMPPPPPRTEEQRTSGGQGLHSALFSSTKPISDTHKSTLLDLFKSPVVTNAVPTAPLSSTALPPSSTPSAVELSAVEPLSTNAASTSALLNNKRTPDTGNTASPMPELNPEANLPFRAMTILSRPAEASEKEATVSHGATQKKRTVKRQTNIHEEQRKQSPVKPFQPQILKRPPQGSLATRAPEAPTSTQPSFTSLAQPLPDGHVGIPANKSVDHRQTLLSLFGKSTSAGETISLPPVDSAKHISARSRVGSLASGDASSRRGSQTPISPADKGFLLSYLDAVAKGQR